MWTVLDDATQSAIQYIQSYGWYVVFALIAYYLAGPYIEQLKSSRSLAAANNPERLKILNVERQRVRMEQQLKMSKGDSDGNGKKD